MSAQNLWQVSLLFVRNLQEHLLSLVGVVGEVGEHAPLLLDDVELVDDGEIAEDDDDPERWQI